MAKLKIVFLICVFAGFVSARIPSVSSADNQPTGGAYGLTVDSQSSNPHESANDNAVRFGYGKKFSYNVKAYQILSPGKIVLRFTQIGPQVIIYNDGSQIVSLPITFKIDSVGGRTVYGPVSANIVSLAPGALDTISFPCWNSPADIGAHYQATLITNLSNDECPGDDTLKKDLWVGCDDTLSHWPLEPSPWTFGSDSTCMLDGIWYPATTGALLTGAVIYIVEQIPGQEDWGWSMQVWNSKSDGSPNIPIATDLRPPVYTSGPLMFHFSPGIWVPTAGSGLGARFWLFYARDAFKGQYDQYRLMEPPSGTPQSELVSGLWFTGPKPFTFSPYGPTIPSGWYANHYEPILPPPNPYQPVANLIPDLTAITHLVLDARPLPPCYVKWERDLATTSIDEPHRNYMEVGKPITPRSTIANIGRNTEPDPPGSANRFYSKCTITNTLTNAVTYAESIAINKIGWLGNAGDNPDTLHLTYAPVWTPTEGGTYGFGVPFNWVFSVKLGVIGPDKSDHCPYNDTLTETVTALWSHDVGVDYNPNVPGPGMDTARANGIIYPTSGHIRAGSTVNIKARIRNYGFNAEGPFNVECVIKDMTVGDTIIYNQQYQIDFLDWRGNQINNPDSIDITFPDWKVGMELVRHKVRAEVRTLFSGDGAPANDFESIIGWYIDAIGETKSELPKQFELSVIKPNPFSGSTEIAFALPVASFVRMAVYDITGKIVKTLIDSEEKAGYWKKSWDGRDDAGRAVGQGVYIIRMETPNNQATKKVVILSR